MQLTNTLVYIALISFIYLPCDREYRFYDLLLFIGTANEFYQRSLAMEGASVASEFF